MLSISELHKDLETLSNFKRKGNVNKIVYFDFEYLDINYAYDIYENNEKIFVDFLVRDRFFLQKLRNKIIFDENNKIFNITSNENVEVIFKEIVDFDINFKKLLDSIFKYNVSIIITHFNRGKIIEKCLDSIKNQKNEEVTYEVIIIDDKSTDNSCELIKNYITINNLENFKIYERSYNSGGPSLPRNDGIDLASGRYIYIVDSDDYLGDCTIRDAYRYVTLHNSDLCLLRRFGKNRGGYANRVFNCGTVGKADFFENKIFYNPQALCFIKNIFLQKNKIRFDLEHNSIEDLIFISHCFTKTDNISVLSDMNYYYISEICEDNISISNWYGIENQILAFIKCLNYYVISQDSKKFSCFLNTLLEFIKPWLTGNMQYRKKIYIINIFSEIINKDLVDYRYILNGNLNQLINIQNKKYDIYMS